MRRKFLNAVIMGAPGGGKGTISKKLVGDFGFTHVSTGDILRKNILDGTKIGLAAKSIMQQGKLVPDEVVIDLLREEVAMYAARQQSILLDGFPRTLNQAIMLNDFFQVDTVISLQIPHEIIMERMSNRWIHLQSGRTYSYDYNPPRVKGIDDVTGEALVQREDDKPEVVKKRLDSYEAMTSPLIEYYKSNPLTTVGEFAGTESNVIYPVVKSFLIEKMHLQTTK